MSTALQLAQAANPLKSIESERVLLQLLESTPIDQKGCVRAWPALETLKVVNMLQLLVRAPARFRAPDAPCYVLAAAILAEATLQQSFDSEGRAETAAPDMRHCVTILEIAEKFWAPVANRTVMEVLTPFATASELDHLVSSTEPEGAHETHELAEGRLNLRRSPNGQKVKAILTSRDGTSLAAMELTHLAGAGVHGGGTSPYAEVLKLEVRDGRRGQGHGQQLVTETLRRMPHLETLQTAIRPTGYPHKLAEALAPEYLLKALDARETLWRFWQHVQAAVPTVAISPEWA